MGGTNCRFQSSVITDSFNHADNQESAQLHLLVDWMPWSGKCGQDYFYFENSFYLNIHFCVSRKHTLESRITTDVYSYGTGDCVHFYNSIVPVLACHRFQVWHECLSAWMNRQVAFSLSLSLSGSKCLHRGCPAISPSWACLLLVVWFSVFYQRRTSFYLYISESDSRMI